MASNLPRCSFGSDESECHQMQFILSTSTKPKSGLVNVSNLDQDTKILLKLRSSTDVGES